MTQPPQQPPYGAPPAGPPLGPPPAGPPYTPLQGPAPYAQAPARRAKPAAGISRPKGALLLAIGLGLVAFNAYTVIHSGRYYPKALLLTPVAVLVGIFATIVGAPVDPRTGQLPLWARVGYGASAFLGIALGIVAIVFVGC